MNPIYVPLLSALAGALIGSLSSIVTIIVQARNEAKRQRLRMTIELALEQYKVQIANARPGTAIMPMSTYLHHYMQLAKAMEDGELSPERIRQIHALDDEFAETVVNTEEEWRKRMKERRAQSPGTPNTPTP
jgi:hypothetical protein